jgi:hypothetical protein
MHLVSPGRQAGPHVSAALKNDFGEAKQKK